MSNPANLERMKALANLTDGEFSELYRKVFRKAWKSPDGMPSLQSEDLIRPQKIGIVRSNGANWTRLYINRAVYLWTVDSRRIDFVSGYHPGDLSADSHRPWNSAVGGVAKLYCPGEWHVKTPLIGSETEGSQQIAIISDAALGLEAGNLLPSDIAGAAVGSPDVNRDTFSVNRKTVAVPSTAEALGALTVPNGFSLVVKALASNTDLIGVGPSAATADLVTGTPFRLSPGEGITLRVKNANSVFIDAIVAGEGVDFGAEV
jgi:hypothetical protein